MEEQTKNTKCGNYVPGSDTKYSMKKVERKKSAAIGEGDLYSGGNQMEKGKEENGERGERMY